MVALVVQGKAGPKAGLFSILSTTHPLRNQLIGSSRLRNVDVARAETQSNPVLGT